MKRTTSIGAWTLRAAGIAIVLLSSVAAAQNGRTKRAAPYNPYPPGILPDDLNSELERVLREVDLVEGRALARWHALAAPGVRGQPPTLEKNGTELIERLGELMNFCRNMSSNRNEACMSCHMPYSGFSGPIPSVNLTIIAYPGTAHFRVGKRVPQRHTYAPFFPVLQYNQTQGLFFGGNFFDSRATGFLLRNPDAEQAQGPPVDTQEMGFPDAACVAFRLTTAAYRPLFEQIWGAGSLNITFPKDTEPICDTPGGASRFHGSDASSVPILQLGLSSGTLSEQQLYDYGQNFVRTRLATIPGISVPLPYGGKVREVMVDLDPDALYGKGLSATDISNALSLQNLILPTGTVKVGTREYLIRLNSSPALISAMNDLPIKTVNGAPVYMRDVGQVRDGYQVR